MRCGIVVAFVAAGCGSRAAPETMENVTTAPKKVHGWKETEPPVAAPRPDLPVEQLIPDLHEELRWPLSAMSHPELAPRFDIASVFAQPGIGWLELCERGVQNRIASGRNRDELEYLRGWCSAVKGDADTACSKLAPLTSSVVLGIPAAVRTDIANIIANAGDIDKADKLLAKHRIVDIDILDTLAATYVELGKERDAYEINRRALDSTAHTTNPAHCRRLVKEMVLGAAGLASMKQLEDLATKLKVPDPTCVSLHRAMKCRLGPASACRDYFKAEGIDPLNIDLLDAYRAWPRASAGYQEWLWIGQRAINATPVPGAELLASIALDAAFRVRGRCQLDLERQLVYAKVAFKDPELKRGAEALYTNCVAKAPGAATRP